MSKHTTHFQTGIDLVIMWGMAQLLRQKRYAHEHCPVGIAHPCVHSEKTKGDSA